LSPVWTVIAPLEDYRNVRAFATDISAGMHLY
jgi:hypothetical protein